MTREELKALKHIEDRINWLETESQDELERVGYTVEEAGRDAADLRSLLSLARRMVEMEEASYNLGSWMSAALDDPSVCTEMKSDIEQWFAALTPTEKRERNTGGAE